MRKTKLSFDLFAQQHGNDELICTFLPAPRVRHPPAKAGLKGVHRQDCRRQPPTTALSRQGGYAHTLKGYFYTNLGGTLIRRILKARLACERLLDGRLRID